MKKAIFACVLAVAITLTAVGTHEAVHCLVRTEMGDFAIEIYPGQAPATAANFLRYIDAKLYNGTSFFRIVTMQNQPNNAVKIEVIQGGDVPDDKAFPPIAHETTEKTGIMHRDGTVSMARAAPGTATCSFFLCVGDQPELDYGGKRNPDGQGFAAFGRVVSGMEVVRRIHGLGEENQYLKKPIRIIEIRRAPEK